MNDLDQAKQSIDLLSYIEKTKTDTKSKFIKKDECRINPCPKCGHKGHFSVFINTNSYSSYSNCCKGGSIIDYLMEIEGYSKQEAINKTLELAGGNISVGGKKKGPTEQKSKVDSKAKEEPASQKNYDFTPLIEKLHENVGATDYFKSRGFSKGLIDKYKLGYSPGGYNQALQEYPELYNGVYNEKAYKYIIPIADIDGKYRYFIARRDDSLSKENSKTLNLKGLGVRVFNDRYILASTCNYPFLFVVEGWADALSIEELGYKAIAINSTTNSKRFIELVKGNKDKLKNTIFVVVGDNDSAGQGMNKAIMGGLKGLNIAVERFILNDKYKDVNEYLVGNREGLKKDIRGFLSPWIDKDFTCTYAEQFIREIEKSQRNEAISTGFKEVDGKLGGGIYPGLYCIGGISSLGKTSFTQQIADYIASQGKDVLFFSLEMSKFEMFSKSMSRGTFKNDITPGKVKASSAREIMQGNFDVELARKALMSYEPTGRHMAIVECNFDTGIDEIRERIKEHQFYRSTNPVVIIDYLQILKPLDMRMSDKQNIDYAVTELKRMSRGFEIPIIVISSLNRNNYSTPISFESFKETGSIEYSCDVIMGIQLAGIYEIAEIKKESEKRDRLNELKSADPRQIEFVTLKNRNGIPYFTQPFEYYPKFNYFKEKQ